MPIISDCRSLLAYAFRGLARPNPLCGRIGEIQQPAKTWFAKDIGVAERVNCNT